MRIQVRFQFKEYPFAPKASRKSRALAILTTWPMLACGGFFWMCMVNFVLAAIIASSDACIIAAFISLILYAFLVCRCKKNISAKIDAQAAEETLQNLLAQKIAA